MAFKSTYFIINCVGKNDDLDTGCRTTKKDEREKCVLCMVYYFWGKQFLLRAHTSFLMRFSIPSD